jgi:hypothetical protein
VVLWHGGWLYSAGSYKVGCIGTVMLRNVENDLTTAITPAHLNTHSNMWRLRRHVPGTLGNVTGKKIHTYMHLN